MTTALLLNMDYTPISTVSLKRLISLLMNDRVEVVETIPDKFIRSPSKAIAWPSVLRLKYYANIPRRRLQWSRRGVFERDQWRCVYCNSTVTRETATVDHLVSITACRKLRINASTWTNTVCSCARCNFKKRDKSLEDSGLKFYNPDFIARIPRTNYLILSGEVPDNWKVYLRTA